MKRAGKTGMGPEQEIARLRRRVAELEEAASRLHHATDAFSHLSEFLRGILSSLPEQIVVLDELGNIITANETVERKARKFGDPDLSFTGGGVDYLEAFPYMFSGDAETAGRAQEGVKKVLESSLPQFNPGAEKKGLGTGLGTTYAYLVVKAHGGEIAVESGEGTTVTVKLRPGSRKRT